MSKPKLCPFCVAKLPTHTVNCNFGNLPPAHEIRDRDMKKKQVDMSRLRDAVYSLDKVALDGKGNNIKNKVAKK